METFWRPGDVHYYEPAQGHGLRHDPFNAIIAPRPIGWISTCSSKGRFNLAPYSFFNAFSYQPPTIGFSSIGHKDTLKNVLQTNEFVFNLATVALGAAMSRTSATEPYGVDEFEKAGLTAAPSRQVRAPRVAESPVSMECRVTQVVQLRDIEGQPVETWLVLGQVLAVHIATAVLKEGVFDMSAADPIMRAGGRDDYVRLGEGSLLRVPRPASAR